VVLRRSALRREERFADIGLRDTDANTQRTSQSRTASFAKWIDDPASNNATLILLAETVAGDTLVRLQLTTRSMLGTLAYETGGISIADGLVRLLGSGTAAAIRTKSAEKVRRMPL
jgi:hypothetical protein